MSAPVCFAMFGGMRVPFPAVGKPPLPFVAPLRSSAGCFFSFSKYATPSATSQAGIRRTDFRMSASLAMITSMKPTNARHSQLVYGAPHDGKYDRVFSRRFACQNLKCVKLISAQLSTSAAECDELDVAVLEIALEQAGRGGCNGRGVAPRLLRRLRLGIHACDRLPGNVCGRILLQKKRRANQRLNSPATAACRAAIFSAGGRPSRLTTTIAIVPKTTPGMIS